MDSSRNGIHAGLSPRLFGTPGAGRSRPLWGELSEGAPAAVVLADTRRPEDCLADVGHSRRRCVPSVVAGNRFPGARAGGHDVSYAPDLDRGTPAVLCEARDRKSGRTS